MAVDVWQRQTQRCKVLDLVYHSCDPESLQPSALPLRHSCSHLCNDCELYCAVRLYFNLPIHLSILFQALGEADYEKAYRMNAMMMMEKHRSYAKPINIISMVCSIIGITSCCLVATGVIIIVLLVVGVGVSL